MVQKLQFQDAKRIITEVVAAANAGAFETRAAFMDMLDQNPALAVQGYNAYGKIFFWNDASSHIYGHRESEAINQDLVDLILPQEMRLFARDMIAMARKTGKMPDPGAYDLVRRDGEYVTVYSGHLVFQWENATTPEFYCVDLAIDSEPEGRSAPTGL